MCAPPGSSPVHVSKAPQMGNFRGACSKCKDGRGPSGGLTSPTFPTSSGSASRECPSTGETARRRMGFGRCANEGRTRRHAALFRRWSRFRVFPRAPKMKRGDGADGSALRNIREGTRPGGTAAGPPKSPRRGVCAPRPAPRPSTSQKRLRWEIFGVRVQSVKTDADRPGV